MLPAFTARLQFPGSFQTRFNYSRSIRRPDFASLSPTESLTLVGNVFLLNSGQRSHALDTLAGAAPEFAVSLALSMLVAVGLRRATSAWKAASVGLAAAVVGGGLATVLSSAITGNSLS